MTIDAGLLVDMVGVVTQGRADMDQRVTSYTVQVSKDGGTFSAVDGGESFQGNSDRSTRVSSFLLQRACTGAVRPHRRADVAYSHLDARGLLVPPPKVPHSRCRAS
jgi:hypothetical protein